MAKAGRQLEIAGLLFATVLIGLCAGVAYLIVASQAEKQEKLKLIAEFTLAQPAEALERCLSQSAAQRKANLGRRRFPFSPDHPDRRSLFKSSQNVRWTVIDRGNQRIVQLEVAAGRPLDRSLVEEFEQCGRPKRI
jgi:hypothetical protein